MKCEICRVPGTIIRQLGDACIFHFDGVDEEHQLPVKFFECKIQICQSFFYLLEEDRDGKRKIRCIERIVERSPGHQEITDRIQKHFSDMPC